MATITESDIVLLKEEAEQIQYGTIELEFKNGVCLAISHKGRTLTDVGKKALHERKVIRKG